MGSRATEKPTGILNVNKPVGKTSHDIVERVRELTGVRRVGHAGTLDPLADGVLVVCVGRTATRVVEYLVDEPKAYRTEVRLGIVTDTYDGEGEVVATSPVDLDRADVEQALTQFRGAIEQVPPMYSAVKHHGKPLYHLARRGIEVEREPRRVIIHRLNLITWESEGDRARCSLEIECSAGTYVRVLVHDLGQELGCGAYVTGLTRLASGGFRLQDAVTLQRFAQAIEQGQWHHLLRPVDEAIAHQFPALHLDATRARRLCSGQTLTGEISKNHEPTLALVYDPEQRFLGLAEYDPEEDVWRPKKIFVSPYPKPGSSGSG